MGLGSAWASHTRNHRGRGGSRVGFSAGGITWGGEEFAEEKLGAETLKDGWKGNGRDIREPIRHLE